MEGSELELTVMIERQHIGHDPRLLYLASMVKPEHR